MRAKRGERGSGEEREERRGGRGDRCPPFPAQHAGRARTDKDICARRTPHAAPAGTYARSARVRAQTHAHAARASVCTDTCARSASTRSWHMRTYHERTDGDMRTQRARTRAPTRGGGEEGGGERGGMGEGGEENREECEFGAVCARGNDKAVCFGIWARRWDKTPLQARCGLQAGSMCAGECLRNAEMESKQGVCALRCTRCDAPLGEWINSPVRQNSLCAECSHSYRSPGPVILRLGDPVAKCRFETHTASRNMPFRHLKF